MKYILPTRSDKVNRTFNTCKAVSICSTLEAFTVTFPNGCSQIVLPHLVQIGGGIG